jgi:hypothetical protein
VLGIHKVNSGLVNFFVRLDRTRNRRAPFGSKGRGFHGELWVDQFGFSICISFGSQRSPRVGAEVAEKPEWTAVGGPQGHRRYVVIQGFRGANRSDSLPKDSLSERCHSGIGELICQAHFSEFRRFRFESRQHVHLGAASRHLNKEEKGG